jgi:pyruvate dehydrogenase E2 component (dihydrolipoamide acetyltransferase)
MAELKEARVPDIGGYDDVPVIELLVAVGDTVKPDQGLVTLESDKATMEVPAPFGGVVRELKVKVGDRLSEGSVVALIEPAGEAAASAPVAPAAPPRAEPAAPQATTVAAETATKVEPVAVPQQPDRIAQQSIEKQPASASASATTQSAALDSRPGIDPEASPPRTPPVAFTADELLPEKVPYASPAVRLFARELGVDLSQVKGSERGGRISKDDVSKFVKSVMTGGGVAATGAPVAGGGGLNLLPWPKVDFAKFGEIETRELSRIQKISGANLARNWAMIPHVTQHDDADITDLEELRVALNKENEKAGIKLTMLAFLMKA